MGPSRERRRKRPTLAGEYFRRAFGLAGDAADRFNQRRYPEVVSAVQEALELMVKAMCLVCGMDPPKKHRMDDEDMDRLVSALVEADGEDIMSAMALLRMLFVARFWSEFYTLAKYGSSVLGGPSDLFRREEASLAKRHVAEALRGWANVFELIEEHDEARDGDSEAAQTGEDRV